MGYLPWVLRQGGGAMSKGVTYGGSILGTLDSDITMPCDITVPALGHPTRKEPPPAKPVNQLLDEWERIWGERIQASPILHSPDPCPPPHAQHTDLAPAAPARHPLSALLVKKKGQGGWAGNWQTPMTCGSQASCLSRS